LILSEPVDLIHLVLKYQRLAIVAFSSCLFLSIAVYLFAQTRYESETLLLVGQGLNSRPADSSSESRSALNSSALNSLATIVLTDEVIANAARKTGFLGSLPNDTRSEKGSVAAGRSETFGDFNLPASDRRAIAGLRGAIAVKVDERADLLRISFRHSSPQTAANFVNALASSLMSKQAQLVDRPGAVAFFEAQRSRYESEVQRASEQLAQFARSTSTYSIEEQRRLLLKHASDLAASLASARGAIAQKNGEKLALAEQLRKLRPVSASPFVSQLVDSLSAPTEPNGRATNQTAPNGRATNQTVPTDRSMTSDEPLLLVRAYQDGMAALLKLNAELSGNIQLEASFKDQIEKVNQQLDALADKEAEYEQLKRNVSVASASAEIFAKRTVEEEVSSNISAARMSNLRVVEPGATPNEPVFPRLWVTLVGGLVGGIVVSVGLILVAGLFFDSAIQKGAETSEHNNSQRRSNAGAHQSRNTSDGLGTENGPSFGGRRPSLRGNLRTAGFDRALDDLAELVKTRGRAG
jgi:uncharacterized protein involved in exopolysaccharide biosynthesis